MGDTLSGLLPPRPGVSASIYDQANRPNVALANPLEMAGQAQDLTNKIWQTRKAQAEQASGVAYQNAIDPASGRFDPEKYRQGLAAAGPQAALAAQSGLTTNQNLSDQQLAQGLKAASFINQSSGAALAQGDFSDHAMAGIIRQATGAGFSLPQIQQSFQGLPPESDPAGRRAWLEQHRDTSGSFLEQYQLQHGKPIQLETGGEIQGGVSDPRSGAIIQAGQPVTKTTDPATRAKETTVYVPNPDDPSGKTFIAVPQARSARPGASGTEGLPPPPGAVPPQSAFPNGGRVRPPAGSPLLNPNATQQPAATPTSTSLVAPPQGQPKQLEADQTRYQADQGAVGTKQTSIVNLDTALQALNLTNSGRSTEAVHNFYSFLKAQGINPPFKDGDVTQYDIARKALLQYAQNSTKGSGTDLGLDTAIHSNASMDIDRDAAIHVVKQNIGLINRDIGMVREAPNQSGAGYLEHVSKYPTDTVPEAFAWDRLSGPERQAVRERQAGIKGGSDALHKSLEFAAKHKLINLPEQP